MKTTLLTLLQFYKMFLSPLLNTMFGTGCRFHPTCSVYAKEAIEKYGSVVGMKLAVKRFTRCHPFSSGGSDPVPTI